MTTSSSRAPAKVLRTASGREASRWLLDHFRASPALPVATVVTTVAGALLQIVPVFLLGTVVDGITQGRDASILWPIGVATVVSALAGAVMTAVSTYLVGRVGADVLARLREGAVRAVLGMPSARIEEVGRGDVLSRLGDDVAVISKGFRTAIPTIFSAVVLVAIATAGMFGLDWRLGLAGACALPAYWLALRWYLPRSQPLYRARSEAQADRAQALISGLDGIATVRAYRLENAFRDRVTAESWRVRTIGIEVFRYFGRFIGRENRAEFVGLGLIVVVGYLLVTNGQSSLGQVSVAALLFHKLFVPLGLIMAFFDEAQKSGAGLTRLVGVLTESGGDDLVRRAVAVDAGARPLPVSVRGLSFRYPDSEHDVLRDVDLEIPAGTSLALVGATGVGKTTLAALVAGTGTPLAGSVHIGESDLARLDEPGARALVTVLSQEAHVFAGPLAEDLRLAAPDATEEELMDALRTVGADSWVEALPQGLQTDVGEGGERLDVAQVAQIALARLVLGHSPVVVLDESTAEAGSQSAAALERAALAACRGRTTLLVAHRLTQAIAADRIAVLDAGRVLELGTHEELVARGGRYAALWAAWRFGTAST